MLVAIGAFNAWVDPFQQYRIPGPYPPRFYTSLHRYIAPGLAKNAAYDTLLSGSSIVENTRNSDDRARVPRHGTQRRDARADRDASRR